MKNATEYYQNSINKNKPSLLLSRFFKLKLNEKLQGNTAIDIGCGAGNDTIFLLNKGFNVTAIDNEPQTKDLIEERVPNKENLEIIIVKDNKQDKNPAFYDIILKMLKGVNPNEWK